MPDRQIRRGDGHIVVRETQSGTTYQARWWDGPKRRAKTFATEEQAEDHLRTIGRGKRAGTYAGESDLTVDELVAAYIRRGRHDWSTNTVASYDLLKRTRIDPYLGTRRAATITTPDVQRWLDTLTPIAKPSVVQNARTVLSGAYREAVNLGIMPRNPVTGTKAPARKRATMTTWSAGDVARVLAVVRDDVGAHAMYLVALTTGMRPGELRALMWSDLDVDAGIVTVRRSITRDERFRQIVGTETKTRQVRSIALPADTVTALRSLRKEQSARRLVSTHWADTGLVFDRGDGHPLAQQSIHNRHVRVCRQAKVARIRPHDMRHTFATLALERGIHPKIVADILGHDSVKTTLDIYSHVSVDLQREAINALAESFAERVVVSGTGRRKS